MEINNTEPTLQPCTEVLLPWHKPEFQVLVVSVDTQDNVGSGPDLETHGIILT
jgi:hypothetical protein